MITMAVLTLALVVYLKACDVIELMQRQAEALEGIEHWLEKLNGPAAGEVK